MKKCAALLMVAGLILTVSCGKEQPPHLAFVSFFLGGVFFNGAQVEIGTLLNEKDIIKTDLGSFCDISIGGSFIRIKEKTEVVASLLLKNDDGSDNVEFDMSVGKMLCKPKKLLKSEKFTVKTPTSVAAVRGTVFSVEADPNKTTRIKVFEGTVKASKRIRRFDNHIDELVKAGSLVGEDQKIVITEADLQKSERHIDQFLQTNKVILDNDSAVFDTIEKNQAVIKVDDIKKFSAEDYAKDNTDFIKIDTQIDRDKVIKKKRPVKVKAKAKAKAKVQVKVKVVTQEEEPEPLIEGRLFITRYEVYFVNKDGQVEWEGRLAGNPVRSNDRLYVLSEENIFCAEEDGKLSWRKQVPGSNRIMLRETKLQVFTGTGKNDYVEFFADTGKKADNEKE